MGLQGREDLRYRDVEQLAATFIGIVFIPPLYVLFETWRERLSRERAPEVETSAVQRRSARGPE
jgi:hypothetical protein